MLVGLLGRSEGDIGALAREAWTAIRDMRQDRPRANVLKDVAVKLPDELLSEAWEIANSIRDDSARADAYSALAHTLIRVPPAALFPRWCDALNTLSTRPRKDLFNLATPLCCTLERLGGTEALLGAARAIEEVARWWP
jgi:hypothetical protein